MLSVPVYNVIQNKIFELRKKNKISQVDLAHKCGFSVYRLGSIERGDKVPSLLEASTIAKFFNLKVEDVFIFKGQ